MSMSTHNRIHREMEAKKKAKEQAEMENPSSTPIEDTALIQPPSNLATMNLTELRKYAATNSINVTGLKKTEDIRARILEILYPKSLNEGELDETNINTPIDELPNENVQHDYSQSSPSNEGNGDNDTNNTDTRGD